jgi:hypothetical protein
MSREDVLAKLVQFFKNTRFKYDGCPSVQFYGSEFIDVNGNTASDNTKIEDINGVRWYGMSYSAGYKNGAFSFPAYYTTGNEVEVAIKEAITENHLIGIKYITAESVEEIYASGETPMDVIYLIKNENGSGYTEWKWTLDVDMDWDGDITSELKLICLGESSVPDLTDYAKKSEIGI